MDKKYRIVKVSILRVISRHDTTTQTQRQQRQHHIMVKHGFELYCCVEEVDEFS